MTKTTFALLAMLGVGVSLACNNRTDAPPEFNGPLTTSDNSTTVMPFRLVKHEKASASGGAASTETTATADKGGGSTAGAVTVKDSTPDELAETMVEILKSGNFTQLADILVPDQQEAVRQVFAALQPVMEASTELRKALDEKFPGHAVQIGGFEQLAGGLTPDVTITDIKPDGDDKAEGTIHTKAPSGEEKTEPVKFKKIDGKWRLESSQGMKLPSGDELQKIGEVMGKYADALKDLAKKVNGGEIADEKAAKEELGKATAGMMMQMAAAASGMGGDKPADAKEEKPADSDKDKDAKPADSAKDDKPAESKGNKPKNDQPDPLDGTITGPTLRRR
jgi:hypothetical protein